jgi:hypothetical protein
MASVIEHGAERSPAPRATWRAVAIPSEHGGWGLTAEPALLGLLVAPSVAGGFLAAAALVAFVARTPLKVVLVDAWRGRRRERTSVALRVLALEGLLLGGCVAVAAVTADARWWWPAVVAAPLVTGELWYDMRSRSRRLVPELAGAAGIGSVAAMIVLADGRKVGLALGLWLVVAARVSTAIPHVRAQIARLHGRDSQDHTTLLGDAAALALGAGAVLASRALVASAVAIVAVVLVQRRGARVPAPAAKVLGLRQMAMGLALVLVTALGVWTS